VIRQGPPAADVDGTVLVGERTKSATGRAGLLVRQGVGLPLQQALQGALDQPGSGSLGDALQGGQIEVDGIVAGAAGDDFAPLGGEVVQLLQFGGGAWFKIARFRVTLPGVRSGASSPRKPFRGHSLWPGVPLRCHPESVTRL